MSLTHHVNFGWVPLPLNAVSLFNEEVQCSGLSLCDGGMWGYLDPSPAIWSFPVLSGHLVLSPPPPHTGPALISALNILEGFNLTSLVSREQALHWVAEVRPTHFPPTLDLGMLRGRELVLAWDWTNHLQVFSHISILGVGAGKSLAASPTPLLYFQTLKIALALASRLGDPVYDSTITESMDDMLR